MNRRHLLSFMGCAAVAAALRLPVAAASDVQRNMPKPPEGLPFAEHFLALQLSDSDPHKQRLVLSVASNMQKAYGQDKIAIEVIAFGPGIDVLRATSEYKSIVDSLATQGVHFQYCGNTLDTIERETGQRPKMNPRASETKVGVERLLTLAESGYTVVRP